MSVITIIAAFFALSIVYRLLKPRLRGNAGESRLCRLLARRNIPYLRDLRLVGANGRDYQVDILAWIGDHFVVLEVKNYSGVIDGWAEANQSSKGCP